jgi:hypothetical protein
MARAPFKYKPAHIGLHFPSSAKSIHYEWLPSSLSAGSDMHMSAFLRGVKIQTQRKL